MAMDASPRGGLFLYSNPFSPQCLLRNSLNDYRFHGYLLYDFSMITGVKHQFRLPNLSLDLQLGLKSFS